MNIQQIKDNKEKAVSKLIEDCSVFFAFSNEQFEKNKTPLQTGEKYVSMGMGGYLPKSKVADWLQGMKDIEKGFKSEIKKSKELRRENIAYELANHEAYYTGSISDTLEALGEDYTKKEVWKVYYEEQLQNA